VVCSGSNSTYTVSITSKASVQWSKSNNLTQESSTSNGTSYTVGYGSSGSGHVTATIKNSQGQRAAGM